MYQIVPAERRGSNREAPPKQRSIAAHVTAALVALLGVSHFDTIFSWFEYILDRENYWLGRIDDLKMDLAEAETEYQKIREARLLVEEEKIRLAEEEARRPYDSGSDYL